MKHLFSFLFTVSAFCANAQHDSTTTKRFEKTLLPVILYDPFTGFGFGGLCNMNYVLGDPATTRYSNSQVFAMYTTNEQLMIQTNHQIFAAHEKLIWQGKLQFLNWPEYTYGLGASTSDKEPVKEQVHYKAIELEERLLFRIRKTKNFAGLQYRLFTSWDMHTNTTTQPSFFNDEAIGNKGYTASGIGIHLIHDSRDNVQNAAKGKYLELAVNPYPKALGSTQNWTNIRIDGRTYFSFSDTKQSVWANRVLCETAIGEVPYMLTPMPGRYFATRGYVQGRYRGKTLLSLETEYRKQLWKWLGGVFFSNIHTISEPDQSFRHYNPAVGGGLRFLLNKTQKTNLRVDYAQGLNGNSGIYFHITEVF